MKNRLDATTFCFAIGPQIYFGVQKFTSQLCLLYESNIRLYIGLSAGILE